MTDASGFFLPLKIGFVFFEPPSNNQLSGGPPEWGHPRPLEAARSGRAAIGFARPFFWFSCPGGAGPLITTVDQSDIRGLGTGLS